MTQNAPFRAPSAPVKPEWIDYNGHLNMAYYSVLMDEAVDALYPAFGFGPDYLARTGCTTYVAEFHICYVRELHAGQQTYCTAQILDLDEKRFHMFISLYHEDGWLAATGEGVTLHVDQSGPRVPPLPADIFGNIQTMFEAHKSLPKPDRAGRKIGLSTRQ
jgi:acyl-CoA thioester hydrolase